MATNNQPLALSGLASNMDTKTIVQQLMAIERQPQNRLKVKQVTENARQQALKDVQSKLQTLNDAADALSDPALWANTQSLDVNDPTKLGASDEAFGGLLARPEGGRDPVEAGARKNYRQIKRKITGLWAG